MTALSSDIAFLRAQNDRKPVAQPPKLISDFINGRRIMPAGSPFEGIYDIFKTPYLIEIIDNMSPFSEIRHTALKKGVQIAATTGGENIIAYYIGGRPGRVMYLSATDELLEIFSSDRLDPLIDSCGFRELISDQSESYHSRKTGDKSKYKQFPGGVLILTSAQSAGRMRSSSIKIMIRDEIDGAPPQLTTGEGNFLAVSEGRLEAFGSRAKIFDLSTPTLTGESLIDEQYEKGDQRKFFVPCPLCGKMQYMEQGDERSKHGLKGDYKGGELIQGYYLCYFCHDAIFDHNKIYMLSNGVWQPTVKPIDRYFRSYHLPSFYSPPGMTSFTQMRKKYDEAERIGDDGLRSYKNLYLAESFEPSGERPDLKSVIHIRSKYKSGEVPNDVMYLTCAADVQRGSDKFKKFTNADIAKYVAEYTKKKDWKKLIKLPRLEAEVIGHGRDRRTASIIYKKFYGQIDDYTNGAWAGLTKWFQENPEGLYFKRKDGFKFPVEYMFIDSGWGLYTDLVYQYCEPIQRVYACKGLGTLKKDKLKLTNIDEQKAGNIQRFKLSKSGSHNFILVNTNYYKGWLYRNLKNISKGELQQLPNSHITPVDYPDSYFDGLRAEKQKTDGSFHNPARRPNEPLDLWVYNMCASDFMIENMIVSARARLKEKYRALKANTLQASEKLRELVNRETMTDDFEASLRKKGW